MKRATVAGLIAAFSLVQSVSHAQLILDLPDPGDTTGGSQTGGDTGGTVAPAPVETQYAGSVAISSITRKTGGELYVVKFGNAQALNRLDLRVMSHRLKIHNATIVMSSGARFQVQTLNNLEVLEVNSVTSSGDLGVSQAVDSLELQLESFGGNSDLVVTALGKTEVPRLSASMQQQITPDMSGLGGQGSTDGIVTPDGTPITPDFGSTGLNYNGTCTLSGLCINDRVALGSSGLGYITGLSADGGLVTVVLDIRRRTVQVTPGELSRIIVCNHRGICNNQRVSFSGQNIGRVAGVAENGNIYITDAKDGKLKIAYQDDVGKSTQCFFNICRGDRGIFRGDRRRRLEVVETFSSGILSCRVNGSAKLWIVRSQDFWR